MTARSASPAGQQQRLCIARALAIEPEVLLLDEPTASLDPLSTQKVEELVYELRRDMTVVIVTHNMQQAARVSDRTAFMLHGDLVEVAPTAELFTTPKDPRTEAYITGSVRMSATVATPPAAAPQATSRHGRQCSEARCPPATFRSGMGRSRPCSTSPSNMPPRSITALIGPSGCGKSTFLRSINRMHDLLPGTRHTGEVLLDGRDVYDAALDPTALRRRVGMVFQRWNCFPKSIYENVAYGPRINTVVSRAELDRIVESSLRRAALWDEVKDRLRDAASGLSGGQQQRLCIARTLANDPEVLLLDEPASALDPIATQKIEELIFELKRELTIVIVTHNLQQAARASDFTAFFYLGRLIEMGPTERMFTAPREERTNSYITGRFG